VLDATSECRGRDAELEGVAFETLGLHCDPKHLCLSFALATST
jgi:hypothetical protein